MLIGVWVLLCVFPPFLPKGNNFSGFLFASQDNRTLPDRGLLLKERICF